MIEIFSRVQNPALGSYAIWGFVRKYYEENNREEGPPLRLTFPVIPIAFNEDIRNVIYNKHFKGGLFRTLSEEPTLVVGLQSRMEDMYELTMDSLTVGFSAGLLDYSVDQDELTPERLTPPAADLPEKSDQIIKASRRLGAWFANTREAQLFDLLRITF